MPFEIYPVTLLGAALLVVPSIWWCDYALIPTVGYTLHTMARGAYSCPERPWK